MKKIIQASLLFYAMSNIIEAGTLTNNGNAPINVVMYGGNYQPINAKTNRSAQGRLRGQGYLIPAGQNIDIEKGTISIDVFFSTEKPGIHVNINANNSYTINPDAPTWTVTQD